MKRCDVAVVGLGAMGSAAMYQLAKRGRKVIGVDRYSPPHSHGSSHGETRVTRQAIGEDPFYTPMVLRSEQLWAELENRSGQELYVRCGLVIAAREEQRFLRNTLDAASRFDIEYLLLDGINAERRFPALNAAQQDLIYYFEPTSGYLKPEKCVEAQLQLARGDGAELLLGNEVAAINDGGRHVEIRLDSGDLIMADKVIVASGPWMKEMFPEALAPVLKTLLQTLYWFDVDSIARPQLARGAFPVFLCGDEKAESTRSFYGFPIAGGPAGGVKFAFHETDLEVAPGDKDSATPVNSADELFAAVSRYVRGLKPNVLRSVNCLYTATPDEKFVVDFLPGSERVVLVSACSGHGFKHSAVIGELASKLVFGEDPGFDLSPLSLSRFT